MTRWIRTGLVVLLMLAIAPAVPAFAQSNADCLFFGDQSSGAKYCITMPPPGFWNGDLVIFAHGYVPVNAPLDIPWSQMTFPDGNGGVVTMPFLVNSMGYAFATTSYSVNGLAVQQGIADVLDLIDVFKAYEGAPAHVYLVGASEGGLVTTLALERYPDAFAGALAMCAPIGSFVGQVDYWGDFRVVFDYFMDTSTMDVLPGTAVNIPKALMNKWNSVYAPRVGSVLASNLTGTQQLFSVTKAAVDPLNPSTVGESTLGILWYNVFATNDAIQKLGGQPYDNFSRVYAGSLDDAALNAGVKRFKAKPEALAEIAKFYETSGNLQKPLLAIFDQFDPIVPVWHLGSYIDKVYANNVPPGRFVGIIYGTYGHCNFQLFDVVQAFTYLIYMSTGVTPAHPAMLPQAGAQVQTTIVSP